MGGKRKATVEPDVPVYCAASSFGTTVGEPVAKRMRGMSCKCSNCGANPKSTQWQFQAKKKSGALEPVDDKCQECYSKFMEGHHLLMSWEAWCEHMKTPEGKAELEEIASKRLQPGDSSSVGTEISYDMEVSESYFGLSSSEYTAEMKQAFKQRGPRVPSITAHLPSGVDEDLFLFTNPEKPHREVKFSAKVKNFKCHLPLTRESQVYAAQAANLLKHVLSRSLAQHQSDVVLKGHAVVHSIAEHKEKLEKKASKLDTMPAAAEADGGDDEVSSDPDELIVSAGGQPLAMQGAQSSSHTTPPAKRRHGGRTGFASPATAEAAPGFVDDSKSVCSRSASKAGMAAGEGDASSKTADTASKWIAKLPLDGILGGAAKGVQVMHAKNALPKLPEHEAIYLKEHLKLVSYALDLSPAHAGMCEDRNMKIKALLKGGVQITENLANIILKVEFDRCFAGFPGELAMRGLYNMCKPWASHPEQSFDVESPKVSLLPWADSTKVDTFTDFLISRTIVPLVLGGEEKLDTMVSFMRTIHDMIEDDLELDMAAELFNVLCELLGVVRSVSALVSGDVLEIHSNIDDLLAFTGSRDKKDKGMRTVISKMMKHSTPYDKAFARFDENQVAIMELGPKVKAHMDILAECACDSFGTVPLLKDACVVLASCNSRLEAFGLESFDGFRALAFKKVSLFWETCLPAESITQDGLASLQAVLSEVSLALPFEHKVQEWQECLAKLGATVSQSVVTTGLADVCRELLASEDPLGNVEVIQQLKEKAQLAEGCTVNEGLEDVSKQVVDSMLARAWATASQSTSLQFLEVCCVVLPFVGAGGDRKVEWEFLQKRSQLHVAKANFVGVHTEVQSMLSQDAGGRLLMGFQQAFDGFSGVFSKAPQGLQSKDGSKALLDEGGDLITSCASFATAEHADKCRALSEDLGKLLAEKDWLKDVPDNGKWDQLTKAYNDVLADLDPKVIENKSAGLGQALKSYQDTVGKFGQAGLYDEDIANTIREKRLAAHKLVIEGSLMHILLNVPIKVEARRLVMGTLKRAESQEFKCKDALPAALKGKAHEALKLR